MNIYFSPISMLASYTLEVSGDSIILNGVQHSLADLVAGMPQHLENGDTVPGSLPPFVVSATEDSVTLQLPYWGVPSEAVAFPQPIMDAQDGPVELPQ